MTAELEARTKIPLWVRKFIFPIVLFFHKLKFPLISSKEKTFLLMYIKETELNGSPVEESLYYKLAEFIERQKWDTAFIMNEVITIKKKGLKIDLSLFKAGILTQKEYQTLSKARSLKDGINQIIDNKNKASKSMVGFLLLFAPPYIMITVLYFTHGLVKGVVDNMLAPIVQAGGTPPPLPNYLIDDSTYLFFMLLLYGGGAVVMGILFFLKHKNPKTYLKILPIIENEYTENILRDIQSLQDAGISLAESVEILLIGEKNIIKKNMYKELANNLKHGKINFTSVLRKYGVNYNTIALISMGENNRFKEVMKSALNNIEERYKRNINVFLKSAFWIGQIAMMGIAMKPMVDLLLLMSIGQMNFQV